MSSETRQRYFRHDAFISYAHRDNETGIVRALHAQFEEFLAHSLKWEPSVWLDERSLDTESDLEEQIRAGLRDSALLIAVTSETVESRKWCQNEMSWYLTGAHLQHVLVQRMYPIFVPFGDIDGATQRAAYRSVPIGYSYSNVPMVKTAPRCQSTLCQGWRRSGADRTLHVFTSWKMRKCYRANAQGLVAIGGARAAFPRCATVAPVAVLAAVGIPTKANGLKLLSGINQRQTLILVTDRPQS